MGPRWLAFPADLLVGCWSAAGSQLVRYDEQAQVVGGPFAVPASDVPFRIGSFTDVSRNLETQVILFNSQRGGSYFPGWVGDKVKLGILTALNSLVVVEIPAPAGTWLFGADVSVECQTTRSCDAYVASTADVTALPSGTLSDATVLVHKVTFDPDAPVLLSPTLVFQKRVLIPNPPGCWLRSVALGYGAFARAVVADGGSFKVVYTVGNTDPDLITAACRISGTTYVAAPSSEAKWAPGEFATRVAWSRANNTALLVGGVEDGLSWTPTVWGTDRSLSRRMVWQPPGDASAIHLSDAYRGFTVESSGTLQLRLRWFDP